MNANPAALDNVDMQYSSTDGNGNSLTGNVDMTVAPTGEDNQDCKCADPIAIGNGNVTESVPDYTTQGQNPLAFTRYYNSLIPGSAYAATLGPNWRSTFDRYIHILSPTSVVLERADGEMFNFALSGGAWIGNGNVDLLLTQSGSTWTVTDSTDSVETYTNSSSSEAILTSIKARNGYTQTLNWNGTQLNSVVDSYGRTLTFTYQGGLLATVATPDAETFTYGYTNGVLTSIKYPTSPVTGLTYTYTNKELTSVTDEDGNIYASWTYDSLGRAITNHMGTGSTGLIKIAYNSNGSRTVTNALGEAETYKFAVQHGTQEVVEIDRAKTSTTAAATRLMTYDQNGGLTSQTDWDGNVTSYANGPHNFPTLIVEANGSGYARTTHITWDAIFHLPDAINTQMYGVSFVYDSMGELLTKTISDNAKYTPNRTWTYTWANGLLASAQNPRTDVSAITSYTYDSTGALTKITDALGHTTQITAHTGGGLPKTIVDQNGITTTLTYDPRMRLLSSAFAVKAGTLTTSYAYDKAGNLTKLTQPDGSYKSYTYDTAHRLTKLADNSGAYTTYTLDNLNDITAVKEYNSGGTTPIRSHSATYDALGRLIKDTSGATGLSWIYTYDNQGNRLTATDPLANKTSWAYDSLNRPYQAIDALGHSRYTFYDTGNDIVQANDENGLITSYSYDGYRELVSLTSPDAGTTSYTYDLDGNISQKSDGNGSPTNLTYDALDRPLTATYPNDTAENVAFAYDQTGHGYGIGRLTSVTDAVGTLSKTWDERGNDLSEVRVNGGVTLTSAFTYDKASRLSGITYPSGWIVAYARNAAGEITGITSKSGAGGTAASVISGATWLGLGEANGGLTFGNGIVEGRTYDLDLRPLAITDTGTSNAVLQKLTYGYDADDNVTSIADGVNSANSQSFVYDTLNRVTNASGAYGAYAWTYDNIGDRLSEQVGSLTPTNYAYTYRTNQLGSQSGAVNETFAYTAAGSLASATPASGSASVFGYNQANRLSSASVPNQVPESLAYDYQGRQITRTLAGSPATVYRFQYDPAGHLLEERTNTAAEADYVYLGDRPVAVIAPSAGTVNLLLDDRLGTPQKATSSTQAVVWSAGYTPFGYTYALAGTLQQNLRMPGQVADPNAGWYHNGWRDYMPTWGRYLQTDPIGLAGGMNTFGYAMQNPLKFVDPWGLAGSEDDDRDPLEDEPIATFPTTNVPQERPPNYYPSEPITQEPDETTGPTNSAGEPLVPSESSECNSANPFGIPANWTSQPSKKNGGVEYVDPNNPGNRVRDMPANPDSPYPSQQVPYVRQQRNGQPLDSNGNPSNNPEETHIPRNKYWYNQ